MKETVDQPLTLGHMEPRASARPVPGLLLVFSGGRAAFEPIPLEDGQLAIGRGRVGRTVIDDACMSRQHAEVALTGGDWHVRDLGSRNGTALDTQRVVGSVKSAEARVLRVGDSLFLLLRDLGPFEAGKVETKDGVVVGPTLRKVWSQIDAIAARGDTLHVTGETGSGKEKAALRFHASGPTSNGPFVAVNCAAIPQAIAERILFGAKRGAYSGADADADGHVQAAAGGVLFLDEIAELDLQVQAKLLRVLENREVTPLGGSKPRKVDLRVVTAAHADLKSRVGDGKFREDLYFRVARPHVALPPLRERAEEIPWLVEAALKGDKPPHVSLLEASLVRPWPGNVRELFVEMRDAARAAAADEACAAIEARHLAQGAGLSANGASSTPSQRAEPPSKEVIVETLRAQSGNIARTARALGVHRTQLKRWMQRDGIEARGSAEEEGDD